jgi:predicted RNase H-like HicB family nuclease
MKTIKVILEVGKDGYGVSFPEIKNIFGFGETLDAAKEDAQKVLDFYIEILTKDGKSLPKILQGEYSLAFELETEALLKHVEGIVTKTALAKASGINPAQLTHYSSGLKKPRKEQREKIINALHKLGRELISVS